MTSHMSAAYAAVKHAVRKTKKSPRSLVRLAKVKATRKLKGAGGAKSMLKASASYLANHPHSKKAQKMVKRVVTMM